MKVLISAYTGLGNFILKTPMIRVIKGIYPDATIDVIAGNNYGAEFVVEGSRFINDIHILKTKSSLFKKLMFFIALRKTRYDVIFLPFDAMPTFLIFGAMLLSGKKIAHINFNLNKTFKQKIRKLILFTTGLPGYSFVPLLQGRHEIDLNFDLFEKFYNKPFCRSYDTFVSYDESRTILETYNLNKQSYIAIQPSAANGMNTAKIWAPENFEKLIAKFKKKYPSIKVVLVGDEGDLNYVNSTSLYYVDDVINIMGKTTINELATVLSNARTVIAHDSGVMHMANALNVDLIALYGPTDNTRTRPLGKKSRVIFSKNDCFARMYNFNAAEDELVEWFPSYKCMDGISIESVMSKITDILDG